MGSSREGVMSNLPRVAKLFQHLLRLPEMPVLVRRLDGEAGVQVVTDAGVEGRGDPNPAQRQPIRRADRLDLLRLKPGEPLEQAGLGDQRLGDESRGGADPVADWRPAEAPADIKQSGWPALTPAQVAS